MITWMSQLDSPPLHVLLRSISTIHYVSSILFFFNDTATTEIYTLSLHDALPIFDRGEGQVIRKLANNAGAQFSEGGYSDRKSTRLNSSHTVISYAVFCLKKKKKKTMNNNIILTRA